MANHFTVCCFCIGGRYGGQFGRLDVDVPRGDQRTGNILHSLRSTELKSEKYAAALREFAKGLAFAETKKWYVAHDKVTRRKL